MKVTEIETRKKNYWLEIRVKNGHL
jgi:hypothetical protein